jgi:ERG8-type phosphomevalonate kinase
MEIEVKTYGKMLIFGAYSILEPGNIGLVVNVNKGTTTRIEETKGGQLVLDIKNLDISVTGSVTGHKIKLQKENDSVLFIKNAIEYSFKYLNHEGIRIKDIKITSINDAELIVTRKLKTGFGSSATSTVGAVAAILGLHGINDRNKVYKISNYSHFKTQGDLGSGFDVSAACFGSHFFMSEKRDMPDFIEYVNSGLDMLKEEFYWPQNLIPLVIFTGKSSSTPSLISRINGFKQRKPVQYEKFIDEYNRINLECKRAFDHNSITDIKRCLEKSWELRKELGEMAKVNIEDNKTKNLIENLKINGAYTAGLLGAGGGDSILVLCLHERDRKNIIELAENTGLIVFDDVSIINQGYEIK